MGFLHVNKISKSFMEAKTKKEILKDIDFKITSNGLFCISGQSGSGKSTLLNIIFGIESPSKGNVYPQNNKNYQYISYINQTLDFLPHLTIKEQLELFNYDWNKLKKYDLYNLINKYPHQLSEGEKQRILIYTILNKKTNILLLDEPTSSLDLENSFKIMKEIKKESKNKIIILVSHDQKLIEQFADEIYLLKNKKIIKVKAKQNLFPKKKKYTALKMRKLSIKEILSYSYKNLIKRKLKAFLIILSIVFSLSPIVTLKSIESSFDQMVGKEKNNHPLSNKFYLQVCEYESKGSLVISECNNPSLNQIENINNSNEFIIKENIDYMIKSVFQNNNLETIQTTINLKAGRLPESENEVVSSIHELGENIFISGEYLFGSDNIFDYFKNDVILTVVGTIEENVINNQHFLYLSYERWLNYLKSNKLVNISKNINKNVSMFDYFSEMNEANHNWVLFMDDITKIDIIMEDHNLSFEEENKIQLLSPTYNYYVLIESFLIQFKKIQLIILLLNLINMFTFIFVIIKQNINLKIKEYGVLLINGVDKNSIKNISILENSFYIVLSFIGVILTFYALNTYLKEKLKISFLKMHFNDVINLLGLLLISYVLLLVINFLKINNKKVSDMLRG